MKRKLRRQRVQTRTTCKRVRTTTLPSPNQTFFYYIIQYLSKINLKSNQNSKHDYIHIPNFVNNQFTKHQYIVIIAIHVKYSKSSPCLVASFFSSMAQIQIQSETQHPKACFLCYFGVSRPEKSFKVVQPNNKKSWFRLKKPATKRTVPIHEKTNRQSNGKIHLLVQIQMVLFSYKLFFTTGRKQTSVINDQTASFDEIPIIVKVAPKEILQKTRYSFDHVDSPPSQKRRKIDAIITGFSQPGSPDVKSISGRTATLSRIQSVSLPDPTRRRQKHDPVVGLLIILMTLVVLLIWGKACAILCTSAWFYFLPLFRPNYSSTDENILVKSSESDSGDPDLNAEKCKKRVVLEGFLRRNFHRGALM
ncbi:hypothetical protein Ddye_030500 [Dipteronia dyeriana]|uniref:Uncharacterized protein n=1 Tax=Dipteronia dyeriana TaxID=168575 RepID=A0AAD9THH6_9ROSI|nr:hypothetical protein Ddye_030500 [Dipteronia dyeriana]